MLNAEKVSTFVVARGEHRGETATIKVSIHETHTESNGDRKGVCYSTFNFPGEEEDMTRGFFTLSKDAKFSVSGSRGWRDFGAKELKLIQDLAAETLHQERLVKA